MPNDTKTPNTPNDSPETSLDTMPTAPDGEAIDEKDVTARAAEIRADEETAEISALYPPKETSEENPTQKELERLTMEELAALTPDTCRERGIPLHMVGMRLSEVLQEETSKLEAEAAEWQEATEMIEELDRELLEIASGIETYTPEKLRITIVRSIIGQKSRTVYETGHIHIENEGMDGQRINKKHNVDRNCGSNVTSEELVIVDERRVLKDKIPGKWIFQRWGIRWGIVGSLHALVKTRIRDGKLRNLLKNTSWHGGRELADKLLNHHYGGIGNMTDIPDRLEPSVYLNQSRALLREMEQIELRGEWYTELRQRVQRLEALKKNQKIIEATVKGASYRIADSSEEVRDSFDVRDPEEISIPETTDTSIKALSEQFSEEPIEPMSYRQWLKHQKEIDEDE